MLAFLGIFKTLPAILGIVAVLGVLGSVTGWYKAIQKNFAYAEAVEARDLCIKDKVTLQLSVADLRESVRSQNAAVGALEDAARQAKARAAAERRKAEATAQAADSRVAAALSATLVGEDACHRAEDAKLKYVRGALE